MPKNIVTANLYKCVNKLINKLIKQIYREIYKLKSIPADVTCINPH